MYILDWINSWLVFSPLQIGILLAMVLLVFNLAVFLWHCQKEPRIECGATGGPGPGGDDNYDGRAHDMTKTFNTQGDGHDEWLTPKWITDTLGPFELDPCSPGDRRPWDTATYHLSVENDGLNAPWFGRVWCNPPYGRETFKWLDKLASHGNGIALIFARTETKGFHRQVWDRAHSILFLEGRLAFHRVDGTSGDVANAPSCLVAYGSLNTERLRASGFAGKLVSLK